MKLYNTKNVVWTADESIPLQEKLYNKKTSISELYNLLKDNTDCWSLFKKHSR